MDAENEKHLWLALCELGDYFSRLGGSARYSNMNESEIPLYICCRLAEKYFQDFEQRNFIDSRFLESAKTILDDANKHIDAVATNKEDTIQIIKEFVKVANSKLKGNVNFQWEKFSEWIDLQT